MNKVLNINKPVGMTSYDVVRKLKERYPGEKVGHAGTLDPLASGILICLVGDATKRQHEFMDADKEYEFEVLFGFMTDTYDVLGLVQDIEEYDPIDILEKVKNILPQYIGTSNQRVPSFSAIKVYGKPLYRWYLDGQISKVDVPVKKVKIKSLKLVKSEIIASNNVKKEIIELVSSVKSGFRQEKVLQRWEDIFSKTSRDLLKITLKAEVSKGTYVRAIAHQLGQKLETGAVTVNITRTRSGRYLQNDAVLL